MISLHSIIYLSYFWALHWLINSFNILLIRLMLINLNWFWNSCRLRALRRRGRGHNIKCAKSQAPLKKRKIKPQSKYWDVTLRRGELVHPYQDCRCSVIVAHSESRHFIINFIFYGDIQYTEIQHRLIGSRYWW